jgi:hypothetical protein
MITNYSAIDTQVHTRQALLRQADQVRSIKSPPKPDSELLASGNPQRPSIREAFNDFVGQTFYGQMISAMRTTVGKPAYFHGGRSEEIFQAQMDQQLAEHMSDATAETFTGPMFELFSLKRH